MKAAGLLAPVLCLFALGSEAQTTSVAMEQAITGKALPLRIHKGRIVVSTPQVKIYAPDGAVLFDGPAFDANELGWAGVRKQGATGKGWPQDKQRTRLGLAPLPAKQYNVIFITQAERACPPCKALRTRFDERVYRLMPQGTVLDVVDLTD